MIEKDPEYSDNGLGRQPNQPFWVHRDYHMKKLLLPILIIAAADSSATAAIGDTFEIDNVTYIIKSENTVGIDGVDTKITSFDLKSEVTYEQSQYTVVSIERDAFYWSKATSIVLPATIETIEYGGFRSSDLTSITLPSSLKTIGDYAFYATGLSSIEIPEGVTSIGASCFASCKSLKEIKLPSTLKSIGMSCFYNAALESVVLPDGLESLGAKAFLYCASLKEITMPSGISEIGAGTFNRCTLLTSISLPDGIKTIGDEAFLESGLSGIFTLPAALESIGSGAFAKTAISEFALAAGSGLIRDGYAIYSDDSSLLIAFPPVAAETTVNVSSKCIGISPGAFWGTNVTKVVLPSKLRAIGEYAFCQSSLSEINLPESLVYIGEQGFAGTKLTEVTLPSRLPEIQDAVFAQCPNLATVTIPSSVNYIDIRAFTGCSALSTVNALGTTPADLEIVYDAYEGQFYNISSTATLNLRPGCTDAYKSAGWTSYFNTVSESLPAVIIPSGFDPADDATVSTFEGVTISFDETVSVAVAHPAVILQEGPLVSGTPNGAVVSVTDWMAVVNSGSQPRLFPADYDYGVEPVKMEKDKEYYLTIPAGVFKNAEGALNEQIVLHYVGDYVEPVFEPTEISPATDSEVDQICNIYLTFPENATTVGSTYQNTKIVCGELVDGVPTGDVLSSFYDQWMLIGSGKTTIQMFPSDYDSFTCPLNLEAGKDYYVVIPAKAFRNSSWVYNKEIVLHYYKSGDPSGIESIETVGGNISVNAKDGAIVIDADSAEIYSVSGILVKKVTGAATVDDLAKGAYIVRAVRGSDFKVVKLAL